MSKEPEWTEIERGETRTWTGTPKPDPKAKPYVIFQDGKTRVVCHTTTIEDHLLVYDHVVVGGTVERSYCEETQAVDSMGEPYWRHRKTIEPTEPFWAIVSDYARREWQVAQLKEDPGFSPPKASSTSDGVQPGEDS